ncbi:MAG: ATP-grasp domain-containing protein [Bacteroidales bacterium]|nr:ATP-grasp domain-containing protein [Bacteroidales bacterium]MCF8455151.1 ATP-grasp domain-containing protein [Bacteroidales bacterium]
MILIDKPYVSDFLRETLIHNQIPVIETEIAQDLLQGSEVNFISEKNAIEKIGQNGDTMLYTNSENSIDWIEANLQSTQLPGKNQLFKNKIAFRDLLQKVSPNYFYKGIKLNQLDAIDVESLPIPFIIKPAVGFFSLGVFKVEKREDWASTKEKLKLKIAQVKSIYPSAVLDVKELIIEEVIEGEEFAIDCYFDELGKPVILFIMQHRFATDGDVGDRIYFTSKEVVRTNLPLVKAFLEQLGNLAQLKNYPIHVEVRIDEAGNVNPIEVNPMRFGGWCTSAELAKHAFDINTYEHLFHKTKPDWAQILSEKDNSITSIIILDNSTGQEYEKPESFDYKKLLADFEKPLELRKVDYRQFHIFGFLYCETKLENKGELDRILGSDLKEYML